MHSMISCGILGRTTGVVEMEIVMGSAEVGSVTRVGCEVFRSVGRAFGCRRLAKSRFRRRNMEIET